MAISEIVQDPSLLPILQTSAETLAQCQQLLALLDPATAPGSSPEVQEVSLAVSRQQKVLFALLARLRGQNRDATLRVRETKQATAEARQEIDRLHLQLQNLYYEQRHLNGEITACESYDHKYLSLPLIPIEEFLAIHPEHRESSDHDLMVARINHEHAEREKLEQARQELLKRKQALIAENKKRKDDLANLDQDLERFIDVSLSRDPLLCTIANGEYQAAKPIQKIFEKEYYNVPAMTGRNGELASSQTSSPAADDVTTTMSSTKASAQRLPPPEKAEAVRTRTGVIAAFWLVIILFGFPIWWKTTSIYRARLPIQEMIDWADGKRLTVYFYVVQACRPVFPLDIHVETPSLPPSEAQHLIRTTQHALDDLNEFSAHHLRLKLAEGSRGEEPYIDGESETGVEEKADTTLVVKLLPEDNLAGPRSELHADTSQLDVFYPPSQVPTFSSSNSPLSSFIAEELQKLFAEEKTTISHIISSSSSSPSPELAEDIGRRLRRTLKYADTYHLAFSLFTPGAEPSSWDIEGAVQEYLTPLLEAFSPISNFSVDTQVQIHAAFAPTAPLPTFDETQAAWTLKKEDLSAFINAAEWPLSPSIGAGPTINFILYVPSPSQAPLVIQGSHQATSWIVPQWGGVVLLNPPLALSDPSPRNPKHLSRESLRPAFLTFSHQLLTLLGTPTTPASLPFRLQTLMRVRAATLLLSASSTMGSLARLTESLPSIPIPATVAASVSTTLAHLSSACSHLREGRFAAALAAARVAEGEAERSFFEKSMVGQVYFPDEHKIAVYLPLLGPIGVPLLVALIKEIKRVVASRRS
ncbi:hypothetical protein ASPZODRAFT_65435 [Penicilliopsis zonata CBS 506.65]|uniref:GPI transamidase component PIG-S n=1 Tax=Penicilliopsis zonata CBS 506.65 TaxID=1073090 RepID=A0A1L9SII5_9EURO|nr:hypothetical protein ASPZODRAFT_65435 [Penicilliopsis zonata CBS 506.65]OJJ46893.1 hypothetical protein ASPZODRAFT_65435 [Penicilliopsis zonata CBS 506.65]